jgi:hypothetical protein
MTRPDGYSPFIALILPIALYGQVLMPGSNRDLPILLPSDAATLESTEARNDLNCTVKPVPAQLGFDLKYHSGYDVTVPMQELVGNGDTLTSIFRVTPEGRPNVTVYFTQKWVVPPVSSPTNGRADLHGAFALGEGKYNVEWLLRDRSERICSSRWPIVAEPRGKERQIQSMLAHSSVEPDTIDPFLDEPPVKRDGQLKVLILLHAAPQNAGAVALRRVETLAVLSILRRVAQEPRIGSYSMIAFNLDHGTVLYAREDTAQLDFPALGESLKQLQLGTVDIRRLQEKPNPAEFLSALVTDQIARSRPDALIFVGPRTVDASAIRGPLKERGEPQIPVFYLSYNSDPVMNPWRDMIGNLVRSWKGGEYSINRPPDLVAAWTDIMSRLSRRKAPGSMPESSLTVTGLVSK